MIKIDCTDFVDKLNKEDVEFIMQLRNSLYEYKYIQNKIIHKENLNQTETAFIKSFASLKTDTILSSIEKRITYILSKIGNITQSGIASWSYENEGVVNNTGYFQTTTCFEYIGFDSDREDVIYKGVCFDYYESYIPVSFLWDDFEDQVQQEFNEFKLKADEEFIKNELLAKDKALKIDKIICNIKSKLTQEELQYVIFTNV